MIDNIEHFITDSLPAHRFVDQNGEILCLRLRQGENQTTVELPINTIKELELVLLNHELSLQQKLELVIN